MFLFSYPFTNFLGSNQKSSGYNSRCQSSNCDEENLLRHNQNSSAKTSSLEARRNSSVKYDLLNRGFYKTHNFDRVEPYYVTELVMTSSRPNTSQSVDENDLEVEKCLFYERNNHKFNSLQLKTSSNFSDSKSYKNKLNNSGTHNKERVYEEIEPICVNEDIML